MQTTIKSAALALAASSMVLVTPAAAAPVSQGAPISHSVYAGDFHSSDTAQHHRRWHKKGHGYRDRDDYRDYNDYRGDRYYGDRQRANYGEPVYRDTRIWRDRRDGRYYCQKRDGTTGLLIGAGVGALIGNEVAGRGDRTLGAILGAAGGALLGRAIDRSNTSCR